MKKILFMLALMGGLATTASAENKPRPKDEPLMQITYYGKCGNSKTISYSVAPDAVEMSYWKGYLDSLCDLMYYYN